MGTIRKDYDAQFDEVKNRILNKEQGISNEEVDGIFNAQQSMSNVQ